MSSNWQKMTLDKALDIYPSVKMRRGCIYPFVDMHSIVPGNKFVASSQQREFRSTGSRFIDGDTLMARITPCLENGKICCYRSIDKNPAHGSTEFIVLRHKDGITHPEFVYYLTISDQVKPHAVAQMIGSTGRQRVPVESLRHLFINLPPLVEQEGISRILKSLDCKIELNRKMCKTLEMTISTLFKNWFLDYGPVRSKIKNAISEGMDSKLFDLFPNDFEDSDFGQIPKGWKIRKIGNLVEFVGGGTPNTKIATYWNGEYCWATPKDLSSLTHHVLLNTERKVTEQGLDQISSGLLPKDTVIMSSRAPIGYVAVTETPVAINQGFIALKCTGVLKTQFVLHWILSNMPRIRNYANGSTFQEISKKAFHPIKVVYPDNEILDEFENIAGVLHKRCVYLVKQNSQIAKIRDTLLSNLISGELRISDLGKMQ